MKKRRLLYFSYMFNLVFLMGGVNAVVPLIRDLDLLHPVVQNAREIGLEACLLKNAFSMVLGQKNGQVLFGEMGGFDRSSCFKKIIQPRLPYSIKAIAYNPTIDAVFVSATQRVRPHLEHHVLGVGDLNYGNLFLFNNNDGSVIWHDNVDLYVDMLASFGNYVVFVTSDNHVHIRNITNPEDKIDAQLSQWQHLRAINFYDSKQIFLLCDEEIFLYDISTRHTTLSISLNDLGQFQSRFFADAAYNQRSLFTASDGMVCAYRMQDHDNLFKKIGVLHKNIPFFDFKLKFFEHKNVLLGYGRGPFALSGNDIPYDAIYIWPHVPKDDCITLNLDERAVLIDAVVTDENELVLLVAINNNLRMITVLFHVPVPLLKRLERLEIGAKRLHIPAFSKGKTVFKITFDNTTNKFTISKSERLPESADVNMDDSADVDMGNADDSEEDEQ